MTKIELTIAPTYVPNWTCVDAIRELFQNALDQEVQNPENKASWEYHDDKHELVISNAKSKLEAASLLLGQTSVETYDGHRGTVVKKYFVTGRYEMYVHIQEADGRIWYCPASCISRKDVTQ